MTDLTEKISSIVTSPGGMKILDTISPIYGDGDLALHIFNALGTAIDDIELLTTELILQMNPATATWSLYLWEQEYGIKTNTSLSDEVRQNNIIAKIQERIPMNPEKLAYFISLEINARKARVINHVAKNTFRVEVEFPESDNDIAKARKIIDRYKPSHMIYELVTVLNTWGDIANFTWGDLVDYTWRDVLCNPIFKQS